MDSEEGYELDQTRERSLELAIECGTHGEDPDTVVSRAKTFEKYLRGDDAEAI